MTVCVDTTIVVFVNPHYQFQIIADDPDDNKFTDCAIAAHADYIITEDKHFAPLANAGYKPQPITPLEFIRLHLSGGGEETSPHLGAPVRQHIIADAALMRFDDGFREADQPQTHWHSTV